MSVNFFVLGSIFRVLVVGHIGLAKLADAVNLAKLNDGCVFYFPWPKVIDSSRLQTGMSMN